MKLNSRFIFGVISVALAAAIAFIALPYISAQANVKVEIVRVALPIQKGTVITTQDVEIAEVGGYNLPPSVARAKDDVVGRYAVADLSVGDYILPSKVSLTPLATDTQLSGIPSGRVAISLSVKSLASGLSDKLRAADIVRVFHFKDYPREVPELRFVEILSVTDSRGVNIDYSREPSEKEEKRQSATITVLATPEQAKVITGLENDGIAHVALVCRDNHILAEELLAAQDAILIEIYYPAPSMTDEEMIDDIEDATGKREFVDADDTVTPDTGLDRYPPDNPDSE